MSPLRPSHLAVAMLCFALGVAATSAFSPGGSQPAVAVARPPAVTPSAPGSAVDVKPTSELDAELQALARRDPKLAAEVEARIDRARKAASEWGGHVVVGRIVVPKGFDPRAVTAQMEIQRSGWFVDVLRDWQRPVSFGSPDLVERHLVLASAPAGVGFVGAFELAPATNAERSRIHGRVALEGADADDVEVVVFSSESELTFPRREAGGRPRLPAEEQLRPSRAAAHRLNCGSTHASTECARSAGRHAGRRPATASTELSRARLRAPPASSRPFAAAAARRSRCESPACAG
ncbi:MAG: hypothetical protein JNK82_27045 [Myxococcaceae bacterium]|nr:hypothetical protein [Myxococcaceae bacterium]